MKIFPEMIFPKVKKLSKEDFEKRLHTALFTRTLIPSITKMKLCLMGLGYLEKYPISLRKKSLIDKETEDAIKRFQRDHNLPQTGKLDIETKSRIFNKAKQTFAYLHKPVKSQPERPRKERLAFKPSKDLEKRLHTVLFTRTFVLPNIKTKVCLAGLGYLKKYPTFFRKENLIDKETEDAIKRFQKDYNLPQTGKLDRTTETQIRNEAKRKFSYLQKLVKPQPRKPEKEKPVDIISQQFQDVQTMIKQIQDIKQKTQVISTPFKPQIQPVSMIKQPVIEKEWKKPKSLPKETKKLNLLPFILLGLGGILILTGKKTKTR